MNEPIPETLLWRRLPGTMPDADETVLLSLDVARSDEPVCPGYRDADTWRTTEGIRLPDAIVLGWTTMPIGLPARESEVAK